MFDVTEIESEFSRFNGFYKAANMRQVIYDLYKGKCAATGRKIELADADVGHIIPQSDPEYFEAMFPGLDVHNIINLQLLSVRENRKVSNTYLKNPLFLANAFAYTMRLVRTRYHKVAESAPAGFFDAASCLEKITHRCQIDFSKSFAAAIPLEEFLLIPASMAAEDFSRDTRGTPFDEVHQELTSYVAAGCIPTPCWIHAEIQGGICHQLSGGGKRKVNFDGSAVEALLLDLSQRRLTHSFGSQPGSIPGVNTPCPLPDGDWIVIPKSQADVNPITHACRIETGMRSIATALEVLRDMEKHPKIVGQTGKEKIILLQDASSLWNLYNNYATRASAATKTEAVKLVFPVAFSDGTYGKSDDLDPFKGLLSDGEPRQRALIGKRLYTLLLRRLERAVSADIQVYERQDKSP